MCDLLQVFTAVRESNRGKEGLFNAGFESAMILALSHVSKLIGRPLYDTISI